MLLLFLLIILTQGTEQGLSLFDPDLPLHCLRAHNDYRSRHKSPKLIWSGELSEEAQKWADHLAAIDQMERDPNTKEGENIFYMYGGDPSEACDRAVENWYSELRNYDFKNPHESPSTDHFSQVIWKDTKEIGVGTAQSKSGNFFLVARYKPSGNTKGAFHDNVDNVDVKMIPAESTSISPKDTSTVVKETKPSRPTGSASSSDTMETRNSSSMSSPPGSHPALAEPIFENEIISKQEPKKEDSQIVAKQPDDSHSNADAKLVNYDNDMLMTPPKYGKDYQVEIRFPGIEYTNILKYPSSSEYQNIKISITSTILQLYEDVDAFQEIQLLALRNGSVIATLGFIFSKPGHNYLSRLNSAVAHGKLGDMDVSRDYVAADVLPPGYLKLTLPHQSLPYGHCPQPCSSPSQCFPAGCHVDCCSYQPPQPPTTASTTGFVPSPSYNPQPTQPSCPGNCNSDCYPQCTTQCCTDKAAPQAVAPQPDQTTSTQIGPTVDYGEYPVPISCIPECAPACCTPPKTTADCSKYCNDFCTTECPQDCCARKSGIHSRHFGHSTLSNSLLPPLNHARNPYSAYMYRHGALRNPIRHIARASSLRPVPPQTYTSNIPASYWKPFLKIAARYGYKTKGGTVRNTVAPKRRVPYTHQIKAPPQQSKVPYSRQSTQPIRTQRVQKSPYYGAGKGMRMVKDLKSKGAPVSVRYAYRYGDRLLVPIDLPRNMDIKELKGKKFISVPAFKRNVIKKQKNY